MTKNNFRNGVKTQQLPTCKEIFGTFFWFDQFCCYLNQEVFKLLISGTVNADFVDVVRIVLIP